MKGGVLMKNLNNLLAVRTTLNGIGIIVGCGTSRTGMARPATCR